MSCLALQLFGIHLPEASVLDPGRVHRMRELAESEHLEALRWLLLHSRELGPSECPPLAPNKGYQP